jgi:hypothetical protein
MLCYISFALFDSTQFFRTCAICMLHDHSQTLPQQLRHLWANDQSDIVTSTSQVTTFTTDIFPTVGFEQANQAKNCPQTKYLERTANGIAHINVCEQYITDILLTFSRVCLNYSLINAFR